MKICYLADASSIHTQRWVKCFAERGHKVHLISYNPAHIQNVKTYALPKKKNPYLTFILRFFEVKRLIKKIKPDLLHAHYIGGYGWYSALTGFHPFVVSPWGSDIAVDPERSKIHRFLLKYALMKVDLVQCMDESLAERAKNLIGERDNIHIIKEGIDPDLFKPQRAEKKGIIRILNLRKSQEPYSVQILLYAIPKVIKKQENMEFFILKSGRELNKTFDIVKKLGIEKYVKFIDDMPNDKVPKFINSCDIYVDTFYREIPGSGIGKTVLEAMSCELPVLLSNTAGVEIHIKHKVNGYIYKGHDSNSLANAITALIDNPELREKLGKNARAYVVKNQHFNENMNIMECFYEKLVYGRG